MVEPWGRPSDVAAAAARLVLANGAIGAAVARANSFWPSRRPLAELLQPSELAALCHDPLLRALMESGCVPDAALERFLTLLRFALFASIPLVANLYWLFAAQFLIEAISLFWIPAKEAAVPNMLRKDQLEPANQLSLVTTYGLTPVVAAALSREANWT